MYIRTQIKQILWQVEENNYEVTAEETPDRGICARALYDYQAGNYISFYCFIFAWGFL